MKAGIIIPFQQVTIVPKPALTGSTGLFPEVNVRISDDARRSVVFLGVEDDTLGGPGIRCVGTGFFLGYMRQFRYLVTVKHVALALWDAPFLIRVNNIEGGGSENIGVERIKFGGSRIQPLT